MQAFEQSLKELGCELYMVNITIDGRPAYYGRKDVIDVISAICEAENIENTEKVH